MPSVPFRTHLVPDSVVLASLVGEVIEYCLLGIACFVFVD